MNEEEIITAVRGGETDQYAALVERYWIGLVIYCERLVGQRSDAEDIAQKSFIKAFNQLNNFDMQRSRFSTWLYRIAKNTAIDQLRANKHAVAFAEEDLETFDPASLTVERDEANRELREAVAALKPKEQRQVIEAYYWRGKSYQTMADEMGVPINTIKTWMHRAKQQLRGVLS